MLSVLSIGVFIIVLIIASPLVKASGESVIAVTPVGEFPHALEFNPYNSNIYVANRDSGTVSVIDSTNNKVIKNITVGGSSGPLKFNPSNNYTYVANAVSNNISVIDTSTNVVTNDVNVGSNPVALEFNPYNSICLRSQCDFKHCFDNR